MGWRQRRTFYEVTGREVKEPILIGLKTLDDWMPGRGRVMAGMLRGR
jgi:hypothetical protein